MNTLVLGYHEIHINHYIFMVHSNNLNSETKVTYV